MSYATFARKAPVVSASRAKAATKVASGGLRIGEPNDAYEREADRVADEVMAGDRAGLLWSLSRVSMRTPLQRKCACGGSGGAEGECEECKKRETMQRRAVDSATPAVVPPIVREVLRSFGEPLGAAPRAFFEPRFGHDFSRVRVHADSRAAESARAVRATAYTVGDDVVFGAGRYAPGTRAGRVLLAHELTHVVQQRLGSRGGGHGDLSASETEAEAVAASSTRWLHARILAPSVATGRVLARQNDDDAPPHIEREFEVPARVIPMDAPAVPECNRGEKYDPNMKRCRPFMCKDLDLEQARQFALQKLGQTGSYIPRLAAAIGRGRFAQFFPTPIERELTGGAQGLIAKLREGAVKLECSSGVAAAESPAPDRILLPVFSAQGSPPWSQSLINRVVLHECMHLICANLPSRPGNDPYNEASRFGLDPGTAMHPDLASVMGPFPEHVPKW